MDYKDYEYFIYHSFGNWIMMPLNSNIGRFKLLDCGNYVEINYDTAIEIISKHKCYIVWDTANCHNRNITTYTLEKIIRSGSVVCGHESIRQTIRSVTEINWNSYLIEVYDRGRTVDNPIYKEEVIDSAIKYYKEINQIYEQGIDITRQKLEFKEKLILEVYKQVIHNIKEKRIYKIEIHNTGAWFNAIRVDYANATYIDPINQSKIKLGRQVESTDRILDTDIISSIDFTGETSYVSKVYRLSDNIVKTEIEKLLS